MSKFNIGDKVRLSDGTLCVVTDNNESLNYKADDLGKIRRDAIELAFRTPGVVGPQAVLAAAKEFEKFLSPALVSTEESAR